jgi:hypothetical protein
MEKHDVRHLQARSTHLQTLLKSLLDDDWETLIQFWRQPGWTTPAEFVFATVIVDSMVRQAELLGALKTGLLEGSREVVAGR